MSEPTLTPKGRLAAICMLVGALITMGLAFIRGLANRLPLAGGSGRYKVRGRFNEATRVLHAARRRGGDVAARGACAAGGRAGRSDILSSQSKADTQSGPCGRISPGPPRDRIILKART